MSEIYDNGVIRLSVPEGWRTFIGSNSDGIETPKKVLVYKNVNEPLEIFLRAGITVCYFAKGEFYFSPKMFYDNVKDIDSFVLGNFEWTGYTCTSLGYPYTMLEARDDGRVFQVMVLMENGDEKISMEDADVREIIESINESIKE
ncbi:MAG: hypothetical protein E7578_06600 [Ruminococcaceae bacterium]|nr:hypothetical protein [Oscillospiraceae bacterium]